MDHNLNLLRSLLRLWVNQLARELERRKNQKIGDKGIAGISYVDIIWMGTGLVYVYPV